MNYESFLKVVRGRRSIRLYKPDPVNDEIINQIIEAGKWAPSGNNTQPFEIVVVKEKFLIEQIEKIIGEGLEPKMTQSFGNPVIMLVLGDPRFCDAYPQGFIREEILHSSLAAAIENMILASTVLGLGGSVWKTVPFSAAVKIKDLLEIPQLFIIKALLPLGYPEGQVEAPPKRDILIHQNRYDTGKLITEEEVSEIIKKYSAVKQLNKIRAL